MSLWERMYAGLPSIVIAANQMHDSACRELSKTGAIKYIGMADQLDASSIAIHIRKTLLDDKLRQELSLKSRQVVATSRVGSMLKRIKKIVANNLSLIHI